MSSPLTDSEIRCLEEALAEYADSIDVTSPPLDELPHLGVSGVSRIAEPTAQPNWGFRAAAALLIVLLGAAVFARGQLTIDTADSPEPDPGTEAGEQIDLSDFVIWTQNTNRFPTDSLNALFPEDEPRRPEREFLYLRGSVTIEEFDEYWADFPEVLEYGVPAFITDISPQPWRLRGADQNFVSIDDVLAIEGVIRVENPPNCDDPSATILRCDLDLAGPGFVLHTWLFWIPFLAALGLAAHGYRRGFDREAKATAVLAVPVAIAGWVVARIGNAVALAEPIIAEAVAQHGAPIDGFGLRAQGYTTGGVAGPLADVDPLLNDQLRSIGGLTLTYFGVIALTILALLVIFVTVGSLGVAIAGRSHTAAQRSLLRRSTGALLVAVSVPMAWVVFSADPGVLGVLTDFLE